MRRSDFATVAMPVDLGKPRSELVIQSDPFSEHASVIILLAFGPLADAPLLRVPVQPDERNGPAYAFASDDRQGRECASGQTRPIFGSANDAAMLQMGRCLAVFPGIDRVSFAVAGGTTGLDMQRT